MPSWYTAPATWTTPSSSTAIEYSRKRSSETGCGALQVKAAADAVGDWTGLADIEGDAEGVGVGEGIGVGDGATTDVSGLGELDGAGGAVCAGTSMQADVTAASTTTAAALACSRCELSAQLGLVMLLLRLDVVTAP